VRVTLNKRGVFSLNHATYEALDSPGFVELLYDRETKTIGLRKVAENTKHAYPVRTQKNAKSYLVGAKAFAVAYEIEPEGLLAFEPLIEDGILDRDKAVSLSPRARRNGNGTKGKAKSG
jgi:hypothetical protein